MITTIYSHPHWAELQEKKEGGNAYCLSVISDDGELEYHFIKRRAGLVNGIEYFDLVTPRGEGGFFLRKGVFSEELVAKLDEKIQTFCLENNCIAELIRMDPWNPKEIYFKPFYNLINHGYEYSVDVSDERFFDTQFSSKRRNQVRKAMKSGLKIDTSIGENGIDILLDLYQYTDEKYGVSKYYKLDHNFLQKYFEVLGNKVSMCVVSFEGNPITAGMFLDGGDVYHYHFSASHPDFTVLNGSSVMLYEECVIANKKGCKWLDLGSATPGSGVENFKRSMISEAGRMNNYMATKVRNQEIYDLLVRQNGEMPDGYFPRYKRN